MRRTTQITLLLLGGGVAVTALAAFPTRRDQAALSSAEACDRAWRERWPNLEEVCRGNASTSASSAHGSSSGGGGGRWWSWSSHGGDGGSTTTTASAEGHSSRGGFGGTAAHFSGFGFGG